MNEIKADVATMNALFDSLGAVVMALAATMPPAQKEAFAAALAAMARAAEAKGDTLLETALLDLHQAARR